MANTVQSITPRLPNEDSKRWMIRTRLQRTRQAASTDMEWATQRMRGDVHLLRNTGIVVSNVLARQALHRKLWELAQERHKYMLKTEYERINFLEKLKAKGGAMKDIVEDIEQGRKRRHRRCHSASLPTTTTSTSATNQRRRRRPASTLLLLADHVTSETTEATATAAATAAATGAESRTVMENVVAEELQTDEVSEPRTLTRHALPLTDYSVTTQPEQNTSDCQQASEAAVTSCSVPGEGGDSRQETRRHSRSAPVDSNSCKTRPQATPGHMTDDIPGVTYEYEPYLVVITKDEWGHKRAKLVPAQSSKSTSATGMRRVVSPSTAVQQPRDLSWRDGSVQEDMSLRANPPSIRPHTAAMMRRTDAAAGRTEMDDVGLSRRRATSAAPGGRRTLTRPTSRTQSTRPVSACRYPVAGSDGTGGSGVNETSLQLWKLIESMDSLHVQSLTQKRSDNSQKLDNS